MKTLKDFLAAHDPAHIIQDVHTVFARPIPSNTVRYIITTAQNGTPVDEDFWSCLEQAAKHLKAEILVIPVRYRNPTSVWSGSQQDEEWWTAPVRPFLWNQRLQLNKNLSVLADIKTQPTAVAPLASFDAVSGDYSAILGHTKLQLKSIPTPQGKMAKLLSTTGACTVENYTDSRLGKIAGFHHSLSALLVELDGPRFHMRQLHFSKTSRRVIDLDMAYYVGGVSKAPRALAVAKGDTHVDFIDPAVDVATHGPEGLIELTNPQHVIEHDLLDGYAFNPHHKGNPFNKIAKRQSGRDDWRAEVQRAIDYVAQRRRTGTQTVVVGSNHNDFLGRAIMAIDWRECPTNAEFILETALEQVRGCKLNPQKGTDYPDAFNIWLKKAKLKGVRVLDVDESLLLGGVEHGMHGNLGPNGARGSVRNLARIGVKSVTGHGHAPEIFEGHYRTGTSTFLRLEYNHGPSGWLNTHCVTNADAKRQLINIIEGKYRL